MKAISLELVKKVLRSWASISQRGQTNEILQSHLASTISMARRGGRIPCESRRTSVRALERAGVPLNPESIGKRHATVPAMDPLDGITQLEEYCLLLEPERRRSADGQWFGNAKMTYRQLTVKHCNLART